MRAELNQSLQRAETSFFEDFTINGIHYSDDKLRSLQFFSDDDTLTALTAEQAIFTSAGPRWQDVAQSNIGDCYFLAPIKALLTRNPQLIQHMIKDLGNGKVAVRFFDNIEAIENEDLTVSHIIVDKSIVKKDGVGQHQAAWVYLIEKAYAVYRYHHQLYDADRQKDSLYDNVLSSGNADKACHHLLGLCAGNFTLTTNSFVALLDWYQAFHNQFAIYREIPKMAGLAADNIAQIQQNCLETFYQSFTSAEKKQLTHLAGVSAYKQKVLLKELLESDSLTVETLFKRITKEKPNSAEIYTSFSQLLPNWVARDSSRVKFIVEKSFAYQPSQNGAAPTQHVKAHYHSIHQKLSNNELVMAGTDLASASMPDGMYKTHAYQVINCYQRDKQQQYFVQVGNPHGRSSMRYDHNLKPVKKDKKSSLWQRIINFIFRRKANSNQLIEKTAGSVRNSAIQFDAQTTANYQQSTAVSEIELGHFNNLYRIIYFTDMKRTVKLINGKIGDLKQKQKQYYAEKEQFLQDQGNLDSVEFVQLIKKIKKVDDQLILLSHRLQITHSLQTKLDVNRTAKCTAENQPEKEMSVVLEAFAELDQIAKQAKISEINLVDRVQKKAQQDDAVTVEDIPQQKIGNQQ